MLVAPQFAVNAADSNPGRFAEPGGFTRFLNEAAVHLSILQGDQRTVRYFQSLPVVLISYSGGYRAAALAITRGDSEQRVKGLVLLDSLYGEAEKFESWITADRKRFFISTYLGSTKARNLELQRQLKERGVPVRNSLDGMRRLAAGHRRRRVRRQRRKSPRLCTGRLDRQSDHRSSESPARLPRRPLINKAQTRGSRRDQASSFHLVVMRTPPDEARCRIARRRREYLTSKTKYLRECSGSAYPFFAAYRNASSLSKSVGAWLP
ncbi:MAG: hypothetical protein IPK23_12245 [Rhizobiales bacterium]|nr:hypothetical protein [Hyphomicrobiales bacterium]